MPPRHGDLVPGRKTYVNGHVSIQGSHRVFDPPGSLNYGRGGLPRSPAYLCLAPNDTGVAFQPPRRPRQQAERSSTRRRASTDPSQRRATGTTTITDAQRTQQLEAQVRHQRPAATHTEARLEKELSATRTTLAQTRKELDDANANLTVSYGNVHRLASQVTTLQATEARFRTERQTMISDLQRYTTQLVTRVEELHQTRLALRAEQNISLGLSMRLMNEEQRRREAQPTWARRDRHRWEISSVTQEEAAAQRSESPQSETVAGPSSNPHGMRRGNSTMQQTECSICLEENLEEDDANTNKRVVMPCGHAFHLDCVRHWHKESFNCPFCRQEFVWGLVKREDEAGDDESEESVGGVIDGAQDGEQGGDDQVNNGPTAGPWLPPVVPDRRLRTRVRRFLRRVTGRGRRN